MPQFPFGHISYLGIVLVLVLTGMGLPVPEEVPIVLSGWAAANGQLNPWLALAACLVGALLGDCVLYAIGYHFGHNLLREHRLLARFLKVEREERVERMIQQHGLKVFFLARFLMGLRSSVYLAAGVLRMPLRRFLAIDAFCATVVIGLFYGLSYRYSKEVEKLFVWIRGAEMTATVLVVVGIAVLIFLYWRHRHRRRERIRQWRQRREARKQELRQASAYENEQSPIKSV